MSALADIRAARHANEQEAKDHLVKKLKEAAKLGKDKIDVRFKLYAPGIYAICADLERDPYFEGVKLVVEHHDPFYDSWEHERPWHSVYICPVDEFEQRMREDRERRALNTCAERERALSSKKRNRSCVVM